MAKYIAQKHIAPSPEAELRGQLLIGLKLSADSEAMVSILEKHGLTNIDPNQWYPMQAMLNVENDIYASNDNISKKLVSLGIQFAQEWVFAPDVETIFDALHIQIQLINQMFRNVPDEHGITLQDVSKKHLRMFANIPYADDSIYGAFWGTVNRFKPKDSLFTVRIIDNPDPENHPGTCFDVKWGATLDEVESSP
jgi:hypothetical protein